MSRTARAPQPRADALERVLAALLHPVLAVDAEGHVVLANAAARVLLERGGKPLESRTLEDFFEPVPVELSAEGLSRINGRAQGRRVDGRVRGAGGVRVVRAFAAPLRDERRPGLVLIEVIDITEERGAQELAEWKALELERSNAELEQFAYAASHDLQEPLRKILLFGELLGKAGDRFDGQTRDFLDRMRKAAQRMSSLIEGLLAYSRVSTQTRSFSRIDLGELVADVVADFDVVATMAGAILTVGPMPKVDADDLQLRRVFQNLIGNAIKFRRPDLPVEIDLGSRDLGNGFVELWVEDNGTGFDPALAAGLFKPFQRLHPDREGTGMGLAICHRIAVRHGGRIAATARPNEGARFILTLPLRSDSWKPKA